MESDVGRHVSSDIGRKWTAVDLDSAFPLPLASVRTQTKRETTAQRW